MEQANNDAAENPPKDVRNKIIRLMLDNGDFRLELVTRSVYWFTQFYFGPRFEHETAEFHREIFGVLQQPRDDTFVLAAGRGLGKSTTAGLCYVLWSVLSGRKHFVVLMSATQRQSDQSLRNVRDELETNALLMEDFGPFQDDKDQWGRPGLVLKKFDSKIMAASMEQTIRGMRHRHYRPDLFVLDDIEDSSSVKSADSRNRLLEWYRRDIVPAGSENTRIVVLGGILHENSFVSEMKKLIGKKEIDGVYRQYSFLKESGEAMWPERYVDKEAVERLKRKVGNDIAWRQEYLLQIVSAEDRVIPHEWLEGQDYAELPGREYLARTIISVDPASSKKKSADFTAIVVLGEYHVGDRRKICIHPHPINERLSGMEIEENITALYGLHSRQGYVEVVVETTSQNYLTERLASRGINTVELRPGGDKRERLRMAGAPVQAKMVFFHETGCEELKRQILGFAHEPHEDLVDAFSQGINHIMAGLFDPYPEVYAA